MIEQDEAPFRAWCAAHNVPSATADNLIALSREGNNNLYFADWAATWVVGIGGARYAYDRIPVLAYLAGARQEGAW